MLNHVRCFDDGVELPALSLCAIGEGGQGGLGHHKQSILLAKDFIADRNAVHVLTQKSLQLLVLPGQDVLLFLEAQTLQQNLVVASPESRQVCVVQQRLRGKSHEEIEWLCT